MTIGFILGWEKIQGRCCIEIRWPSGAVEQVSLPGVDRYFVVEEGKGLVPSVYDGIARSSAAVHHIGK